MSMLTEERIFKLVQKYNKPENYNLYWSVTRPATHFMLSGSVFYVDRHYPNAEGSDRFVYWPDYKVAGTIKDIFFTFQFAGINQVHVGTLYSLSNGQIGCPPGIMSLSEDVIAACAFDPRNPTHSQLLTELINQDIRSKLGYLSRTKQNKQEFSQQFIQQEQTRQQLTNQLSNTGAFQMFPGGLNYQQEATQARQQLGRELSYLPTGAFPGFPGGQEYFTAQQRNVGQYGMNF
jgi:hypothetical protein